MMPRSVWILSDPTTGDVSYLRHEVSGENPKVLGPFAYVTEEGAKQARQLNKWLPEPAGLLEINVAAFIQALFNGFPPSNTDVFVLDELPLPLSPVGAEWVDAFMGTPQWARLFNEEQGSGLDWLNQVLQQVGERLGLDLEAIQSICEMTTDDQEMADEVEQAKQLVQANVKVAIIPELHPGETVPTVSSTFWLHTKGMVKLGLPELEIHGVPVWWVTAAGAELNAWAAYSTQHPIKDGEILQGGGPVPLMLRAEASSSPYWAGQKCLELVVAQISWNQTKPEVLH